jgi:hypothetical protein
VIFFQTRGKSLIFLSISVPDATPEFIPCGQGQADGRPIKPGLMAAGTRFTGEYTAFTGC